MHAMPLPGPGSRPSRRLLTMLVIVVLAAMLGGPLQPAAGDPAPLPGGPATASGSGLGQTYQVTLLTGDVVIVHVAGDGRQAAWLDPAPDGPQPEIFELDGQVHVIPVEAAPYVDAGVLDDRLFNVTYLVEQGYHDAAREDLPLLVSAPEGPSTRSVPAAPAGTRKVRELASIGSVSVSADKSRIRSVWESVRGPQVARPGDGDAQLAGASKVWLNGTVRATLSDSVAQVGAPAAWDAGLDGSGVRVAVLDTGYDPAHPDLAARVSAARNFTEGMDPPGETAVDGNGHGTHVAATVGGTGAASDGARRGVAPGAELLVGKVLDNNGNGLEDWVIAGMEWAVEQDARVVNLSLGTPWPSDGTDPLSQAVDRLTESSGTLFVVAAGNIGPGEGTVGSPGAATEALTVGAVTKADGAAAFSSRGPRLGDQAIKPEIVAPGADIVAARASGTSLGNLIDGHYTSLSGTSMATPHVAGAAAILAQQNPDWQAGELKARLASTSTPLPGEPVTFQGAGRLDVSAAVGESAGVSVGALSLGRIAQDAGTVTRTLTYHNPTDRGLTLRLSADVTRLGLGGQDKPVLRFDVPVLVVPPGGQASTEVQLMASQTRPGNYAGYIVARDPRDPSVEVRTATAFRVEGPTRTVTVSAVDRNGQPGRGPVQLWNIETGELSFGFMFGGATEFEVPDGTYSLAAAVETPAAGFPPESQTVAGDPELTVRRDMTIHYDARDAQPITVETPRDTDLDSFQVTWHRAVGQRSISSRVASGIFGVDLHALPSPAARTGTFELSTGWQLTQPLLTAVLSNGYRVQPSPWFAGNVFSDPYVGDESLALVYAGMGTPEEFADVDAEGKAALVTRHGQLAQQVEAAAAAGATLLLVHNDQPGTWRDFAGNAVIPVYTISGEAGTGLREALSVEPDLDLDVFGVRTPTYNYELAFVEPDRVPAGRTYDAADHPMATVESDYRQNSERMGRTEMWIPYVGASGLGNGMSLGRRGPVTRTEYVSTDDVQWQRFGQPHGEFANVYWTWSAVQQYEPGETYRDVWWGPLTRPGVPAIAGAEQVGMPVARFHDAIRIMMPHYLYGNGSLNGTIFEQLGDTSELTLRRDGEVVGKSTWPEAQFTVPPDEAEYELDLRVVNGSGNWMDTSVRTESTWRFRSARPEGDRDVLPLVQLGYDLEAGPYNDVPTGAAYPLVIEPGYQPGASGPGEFTVSVEVSYDDGSTWASAPVEPADGRLRATVPAAPSAGFATVRVIATDSAGNSLTQRIDRAWRVSAS
jgi:subtilisin family serine protease